MIMAFEILVALCMGYAIWSLKNVFVTYIKFKRTSSILTHYPEHKWLMKMGMYEQAKHFNNFGLRTRDFSMIASWVFK